MTIAMANFKNSIYEYATTKRTVPLSGAKTGNCTTEGINVIGVGTLFLSEMPVGSWLVDLASDELRKVVRVNSDTEAVLQQAFTVDLASAAPDVILASDCNICTISVSIPSGGAAGEIDGAVFPAGASATFSKDGRSTSSTRDFIDPLIVDAAVMLILISK